MDINLLNDNLHKAGAHDIWTILQREFAKVHLWHTPNLILSLRKLTNRIFPDTGLNDKSSRLQIFFKIDVLKIL